MHDKFLINYFQIAIKLSQLRILRQVFIQFFHKKTKFSHAFKRKKNCGLK